MEQPATGFRRITDPHRHVPARITLRSGRGKVNQSADRDGAQIGGSGVPVAPVEW
jgi:hypothetical protein